MANEITMTTMLAAVKGDLSVKREVLSRKATMSGSKFNFAVQEIGFVAHEAIVIGAVGTEGLAHFRNLDGTHFVQLGLEVAATFYPLTKLKAGESALFRLQPGVTVFALADTAAVNLESLVLED